jgi:hypothetical protein
MRRRAPLSLVKSPFSFTSFADFLGDIPGRGPGEASLRRRRAPVRLWVAVAALVACTIWLWSSSGGLTLASYKAQVRSLARACLLVRSWVRCLICLAVGIVKDVQYMICLCGAPVQSESSLPLYSCYCNFLPLGVHLGVQVVY